jgi:hypothetical protein
MRGLREGAEEVTMPYVTCPTCGERGKIPSSLIGVRIKCRKCGLSFLVSPPAGAGKAAVGAGVAAEATAGHAAAAGPSAAVEAHGIEVEGLDASAWAVPTDVAAAIAPIRGEGEMHPAGAGAASEPALSPDRAISTSAAAREYKLLTSRDKYFDGKFELARLEDALNHFARLGWAAKGMMIPHLKGFTGVMEEVIVVLLERCREAN